MGLTGGIGSGKSAALEAFADLGAAVMSSDSVVHACYLDPEVVAAVRARFGDGVVGADGSVDRGSLGRLVFDAPDDRRFLEQLIHPRIHRAREDWIAAERAKRPPPPLLVCEVPLLFEVGLEDSFDAVLVVSASEAVRRERVASRGQDFGARSAQQLSEDEKLRRADRAYVNDGSLQDLRAWVAECFQEYARR